MAQEYFIRWRGKITGPHDLDELQDMVTHDRLSKLHEISADREKWHPAGSYEDLFPIPDYTVPTMAEIKRMEAGGGTEAETVPQLSDVAAATPEARTQTLELSDEDAEPEGQLESGKQMWFYSQWPDVEGPCSSQEIAELISEGVLGPEDFVMPEDQSTEWMAIKDVPEFAQYASVESSTAVSSIDAEFETLEEAVELEQEQQESAGRGPFFARARAAMCLSLVGIIIPICGIFGLFWGLKARSGMRETGNDDGKTMALIAVVAGAGDIVLDLAKVGLVVYLITSGGSGPGV